VEHDEKDEGKQNKGARKFKEKILKRITPYKYFNVSIKFNGDRWLSVTAQSVDGDLIKTQIMSRTKTPWTTTNFQAVSKALKTLQTQMTIEIVFKLTANK